MWSDEIRSEEMRSDQIERGCVLCGPNEKKASPRTCFERTYSVIVTRRRGDTWREFDTFQNRFRWRISVRPVKCDELVFHSNRKIVSSFVVPSLVLHRYVESASVAKKSAMAVARMVAVVGRERGAHAEEVQLNSKKGFSRWDRTSFRMCVDVMPVCHTFFESCHSAGADNRAVA